MADENCTFCKIVLRKVPSYIIWDSKHSLGLLDPNYYVGTTFTGEIKSTQKVMSGLVIPKDHVTTLLCPETEVYADMGCSEAFCAQALKDVLACDDVEKSRNTIEGTIEHIHTKLICRYKYDGLGNPYQKNFKPSNPLSVPYAREPVDKGVMTDLQKKLKKRVDDLKTEAGLI
jgi:diadenosine tetraphosphate (Ap4A) HIT family hydrolase